MVFSDLAKSVEQIAWHNLPLGDVFVHLNSKLDGLSQAEANERLKHFGLNILQQTKSITVWKIFLKQFLNPLVLILLIASGLTILVGSYLDTAIILSAVILNSLVGFAQEYSAKKSLGSLKKLEVRNALVWRDGQIKKILAENIVPGDIIVLRPGDRVPADARLIKSFELKTGENILTGESNPVYKSATTLAVNVTIFERTNTVFGGTVVLDGTAQAIVFGSGENSEIGRTARFLRKIPQVRTPFEEKVIKLSRFIGIVVTILSALIMFWGLASGKTFKEMFLVTVAIAVSAVPESLSVAITVILAVGMKKILKAGGLVRSLAAAETLGSTSVILTDKTGTLTYGYMSVAKVLIPERISGLLRFNAAPRQHSNYQLALAYGMLSAEAIVENPQKEFNNWIIQARPIDKALVMAAGEAEFDWEQLNKKFKKVGEIAFNNERKFGVSFRENPAGEIHAILAGAPDVLWGRIKKIQILNRFENVTPLELSIIKETVDDLAKSGLRVIAICSKKIIDKTIFSSRLVDGKLFEVINDLNVVGLIGIKDSVRSDAKDFLAASRRAGIRTVMVTGDHSLTARTIANEAGLLARGRTLPEVMEGKDIDIWDAKELGLRVRNVDIFSRVTPAQKFKIVEAWQSQGETVAVLGDGINDAPALKQANIGVSLGSGVDLARETSDLILLENSFSSLVRAISEGRVILDNIKKVIAYLLSTSLSEMVLVSLSLLLGLPLPIVAVQILWVNLIHESLPAMALAIDPAEKDVISFAPDKSRKLLLDDFTRFLVGVIGVVSAVMLFGVFYFFQLYFESIPYAQSVTFVALGVSALFHAFAIRSLRRPIWEISLFENKYLVGSFLVGLMFLAAAVYIPSLQAILGSEPLGFLEWVIVFGVGILNVIFIEITKWAFIRRRDKNRLK